MNQWDKRYAEDGYAYGTAPNAFLAGNVAALPMGRVLCLADGEGRNSVWLAGQGYGVTAVDLSPIGMEKAQALAAERGVSIQTAATDLADFDIEPNAWQGVVSIFGHLPPDTRRLVHGRCVSGLVPGGVFLLEAYTPDQIARGTGGPPDAAMMMTADGLREELAGLEILTADEIVRDVSEGRYHTGAGAVVRVIARKPEA